MMALNLFKSNGCQLDIFWIWFNMKWILNLIIIYESIRGKHFLRNNWWNVPSVKVYQHARYKVWNSYKAILIWFHKSWDHIRLPFRYFVYLDIICYILNNNKTVINESIYANISFCFGKSCYFLIEVWTNVISKIRLISHLNLTHQTDCNNLNATNWYCKE